MHYSGHLLEPMSEDNHCTGTAIHTVRFEPPGVIILQTVTVDVSLSMMNVASFHVSKVKE